ncbi:MAG: hypothetical protein HON43_04160 [Alphaproteobacteria bacterium]|jgi:hypothetical protein|nr:hypothetical protein [Alphaproteobacteria bacterium]MBT5389873.1 hypothetical protein [Alphaproteobacteria bacterium]
MRKESRNGYMSKTGTKIVIPHCLGSDTSCGILNIQRQAIGSFFEYGAKAATPRLAS